MTELEEKVADTISLVLERRFSPISRDLTLNDYDRAADEAASLVIDTMAKATRRGFDA